MNVNSTTLSAMKFALMVFFFLPIFLTSVLHAEEDVITDIILINGLAELVDLNHDGEVLLRHMSIPDYFSSGRSHKSTLRESLAKTKVYGASSKREEYIDKIIFKAPIECRQSLMRKYDNEGFEIDNALIAGTKLRSNSIEKIAFCKRNILSCKAPAYNKVIFRNRFRRQRTLIDDRLKNVDLFFKPTYRTSKAIIDV